jgi:hypothetical protein
MGWKDTATVITPATSDWKASAVPVPTAAPNWKDTAVPVTAPSSDWKASARVVTPSESSPLVDAGSIPGSSTGHYPSNTPLDDASSVDKEIESRGAFDKPLLVPEKVTDKEIQQIAAKEGVDPAKLRSYLPNVGGRPENPSLVDVAAGLGSVVGEGVTMGVPQKLYKMAHSPAEQRAMDKIQELAAGRKSYIQKGAEFGAGLFTGSTEIKALGGGLKAVAVTGAGFGAATGFGGSKQGQEVADTITHAVLGAGLSAAGHVAIGKALQLWKGSASKSEAALMDKAIKEGHVDVRAAAERSAERTAPADEVIFKAVDSGHTTLNPDDAEVVAKTFMSPEDLEAHLTPGTAEYKMAVRRIHEGELPPEVSPIGDDVPSLKTEIRSSPEQIKQLIAKDVIDGHIKDLAKDILNVTPKNSAEALQGLDNWSMGAGGRQILEDRYKQFMDLTHVKRGISNEELQITGTGNFTDKVVNFLSTKEPVMRAIDARSGTSLERRLQDINVALNRSTTMKNIFKKRLNDYASEINKLKLSPESENIIYKALDSGDFSALNPAEAKAAQGYKAITDDVKDLVNGVHSEKAGVPTLHQEVTPLSIQNLRDEAGNEQAGYVSKFLKSPEELIRSVQNKEKEALETLSSSLDRPIRSLAEVSPKEFQAHMDLPVMQDLLWPVRTLENVGNLDTGRGLQNGLDRLYGREGRMGLEVKAKAAMSREGGTPPYLLEKNRNKLLSQYIDNNISTVYLRPHLTEMGHQAQALRAMGDTHSAEYVENAMRDARGIRAGSLPAEFRQRMTQANIYFDNLADKYGRDSIRGQAALSAKNVPSMLHNLTLQIYPNAMGWNIRSFVQNQLQVLTKTYPELGLKYGVGNLRKAIVNVFLNRKAYIQKAERMGVMQPQYQDGVEQAVAEGIQSSALWKMTKKVLEANAKLSMAMHQFGETNNRCITLAAAEQMTKDLIKKDKWAIEALQRFPTDLQRDVAAMSHDPAAVETLIAKHLTAETQYFYSKASMSEFGAIMGPLFTQFTNWPSATLGGMIGAVRTRGLSGGAKEIAAKYVAPWVILAGIQHALLGDPEDMSDAKKLVVGRSGLSSAAPIGSIKGMLAGDFIAPPIVKSLRDGIIAPALKGENVRLDKGISSLFQAFTPGAGTYKFLSQDLETYLDAIK